MIERLLIGLLCGLLAAAPMASELDSGRGLGGTGHTADDRGGIGGTGYQPSGDGRGIGGTGIVGTIRGFGSIWVNGVEVHYREDQALSLYDGPGTPKDLRVGQVVAVEAEPQAARLVARSIEVRHAVVGPVASIDGRGGTMQVLGQKVRLPPADPLTATLRPGEWVSVSGLRDPKGVVIASLLERPPEGAGAFVRGEVQQDDDGGLIIGGRRYTLPPAADPAAIPVGADLTLYGEPDGDLFSTTRIRLGWVLPFDGRVRNFLLEGFVGTDGRRVGALSLPDSAYRPEAGERVVVQGRYGVDGRLDQRSLRVLSAPSGLDRLRLRLEDREGGPGTAQPSTRQGPLDRARPSGPYRLNGTHGGRPAGLSPRPQSLEAPGGDTAGRLPWGQGRMGYDPQDPLSPGYSSGWSGFPMPPAFGFPGGSGVRGGLGAPAAPTGRGGR